MPNEPSDSFVWQCKSADKVKIPHSVKSGRPRFIPRTKTGLKLKNTIYPLTKKYDKRPLSVKKPIFPQYISFIINYILETKHFQVQKQCFFIFTTKKFNNFCRLAIV